MPVLPPAGPLRRRQLMRLAALAFVLVTGVVLWLRYGGTPTSDVMTTPTPDGDVPMAVGALPQAIQLGELAAVPALEDAGRNPFAFGGQAASSVPIPAAGAPYIPAPAQPARPQGPPPIQLRLTVLAVLPGSDRSLVTLTDPATHGLYQGFEGDIVDGRYRIVKVGLQSVVVSYVDGSGARTLSLGG